MNGELRRLLVSLGCNRSPRDALSLSATDVQSVCDSASSEGLVALLGAAIETGVVTCADADRARVGSLWMERLAWCVQLDIALVEVVERLTSAGIDNRVLKGSAVAMLDEPDPSWRTYGDVDVLVPRDELLAAAEVLASAGWLPVVPPVNRRWAARHAKSLTLVNADGVQVDLHRLLANGPFGQRLDESALFAHRDKFAVADRGLVAMSRPLRFLHACYHAVLGGTRGARHDRDILLLSTMVSPEDLAEAWHEGWSQAVVEQRSSVRLHQP